MGRPRNAAPFVILARFMLLLRRMRWMEIIRLRTTRVPPRHVSDLFLDLANGAAAEPGLVGVRMHRSASRQTDLAFTLSWDTATLDPRGSRTGLTIAEELKAFGLVDHSIWREEKIGA
jgi:hypothetical protein